MKITSFEGIVENGRIRLPADLHLPEKAKVYVIVPDVEIRQIATVHSPRLAHPEQAEDFKKEVFEETSNASL
ncbi:MAG TPA: hypothetical protein VJ464_23910 [Blastocatellia bacterium]|nr:hypothetical protein [Blastocatellia bacterium]